MCFPCSADHEQDWQPCPVGHYSCYSIPVCVMTIHTCIDYMINWKLPRNSVSPRFSPSMEMSRLTRDRTDNPSRETKFSGVSGDREIFIFPVQLTTSRIGNLARLVITLATVYQYVL